MFDIFGSSPAFGVMGLTALVNKQPYVPGQIGRSGLFESAGVSTLTLAIEERHGDLALVAPTPRGGPGETTDNEKRNLQAIRIPHYQRDDGIMADEVQGLRTFGGDGTVTDVTTLESKVAEKMLKHTRALDATLEHQRSGALKGIVVDKNGNVLVNLYTMFGLQQPAPVNFNFSNASFQVRQTCSQVQEQLEDALDEPTAVNGLRAFCGPTFWNSLLQNAEVRSTYLNYVEAAKLRGNAWGSENQFEYGGITFERYRVGVRATASAAAQQPAAANSQPVGFIAPNEVRFALNAPGLFLTRFGPADYIETVNTMGLPRYARQWPREDRKGVNMQIQMNAISFCTRPEALLGGYSS